MNTLQELRIKASEDSLKIDKKDIIAWHKKVIEHGSPTDVHVPLELGSIYNILRVCDNNRLPIFGLDDASRLVSVAKTYGELYNYELDR